MSKVKVKSLETVNETLAEIKREFDSTTKTQSERMEAAEKQLEDAQGIIEELKAQNKKITRVLQSNQTGYKDKDEAWGSYDKIPEGWSKKDIHDNIIVSPTKREEVKIVHVINDDVFVLSKILDKHPSELKYWDKHPKHLMSLTGGKTPREFMEKSSLGKALASATGSSGANWVPEGWSDEMLTDYEQALLVTEAFDSFDMPQDPFNYPFMDGGDIEVYLRGEPVKNEASKIKASEPSDENIQFATKELAARVVYSRKLDEDAITVWLPTLKNKMSRRIAEAHEGATINGDTSSSHMDSDVTSGRDYRKAWKGLRKWANSESTEYDVTTGGSSFQSTDALQIRKKMTGGYGVPSAEGLWIVSNAAYLDMIGFDAYETVDKAGEKATIFTGQIGVWYGWPVIVSPKVREDLDSSGVYDSSSSQTEVIGVHYPSFMNGYRRTEDIETDYDPETGQYKVIATMRVHFRALRSTGQKIVGAGINV